MGCTASKAARLEAKRVAGAQSSLARMPDAASPGSEERMAAAAVAAAFNGVVPDDNLKAGALTLTAAPTPRSSGLPAPASTVVQINTANAEEETKEELLPTDNEPSNAAADLSDNATVLSELSDNNDESNGDETAELGPADEAALTIAPEREPLPLAGSFVVVHTQLKDGRPVSARLAVLAKEGAARQSFFAACKAAGAHLHAVLPGASGSALATLWEVAPGVDKAKCVTLCATYLGTAKIGRSTAIVVDEGKGAVGLPPSRAAPVFAAGRSGSGGGSGGEDDGRAYFVVRMTLYDEADFFSHLALLHGNDRREAAFSAACQQTKMFCRAFYPADTEPLVYAVWIAPKKAEATELVGFVAAHVLPRHLGEVSAFRIGDGDFVCGLPE